MVKKVDGLHMSTSRTQLADLEADTCFAELLFTIPGYVSFTQIRRWCSSISKYFQMDHTPGQKIRWGFETPKKMDADDF